MATFSGHWGDFFKLFHEGLRPGSDLVAFQDFCTPNGDGDMPEGWANVTVPGQSLET